MYQTQELQTPNKVLQMAIATNQKCPSQHRSQHQNSFFLLPLLPDFIHTRLSQHKCQKLANERTLRSMHFRKDKHDIRHKDYPFEVGDRVFYKHSPPSNLKFTPIFDGPFFIVKKTSDVNYHLATSINDKSFRTHISQLKPFVARDPRSESSEREGSVISESICVSPQRMSQSSGVDNSGQQSTN